MLRLEWATHQLPFRYPFTTAHGLKTHQPTLTVSLGMGRHTGRGEAPAISYYGVSSEAMAAVLERQRGAIERYALTDPERFWHFLHHLIPGEHFLTCALDMAGWDLFARLRRKTVAQLIGADWNKRIPTDYTLGLDTAEQMIKKLQAKPWPVFKIKLAAPDDIDLLRALRRHTDAPFRVDANEGWDADATRRLLPELQALGVMLLEQPLPRTEHAAMQEIKAISSIPLFADEACHTEADIDACAAGYHGINIKLTKCGGITPARRMITRARQLGLQVMIGSMNESSIGTAGAAQLLPLVDFADLDGPMLLAEDLAAGLSYDGMGGLHLAGEWGTGLL